VTEGYRSKFEITEGDVFTFSAEMKMKQGKRDRKGFYTGNYKYNYKFTHALE